MDKKAKNDFDQFKDYKTLEEYIEDIVTCLIHSSWQYSEERARECREERKIYIEYAFEHKEPPDDCSAEVGYHCG